MTDSTKLEAAVKAAYPELWPDDWEQLPGLNKASLAYHRQAAMDRLRLGIEAYAEAQSEGGGSSPLADYSISLPEDAAMIQQVLTIVSYIDNDGRTAYVVRTMGDGLRTSWLGMCVLAQDYILKLPSVTDER